MDIAFISNRGDSDGIEVDYDFYTLSCLLPSTSLSLLDQPPLLTLNA
jgi:hypothetical protein